MGPVAGYPGPRFAAGCLQGAAQCGFIKNQLGTDSKLPFPGASSGTGRRGGGHLFRGIGLLDFTEPGHLFLSGTQPPSSQGRFHALLSFVYSLLANLCASALEGAGLDSYVGFLHRDRPGRASLALDLMEELRPVLGDRFALTLINHRLIRPEHFDFRENGSVLLNDLGRRVLLNAWQERKRETLTHPFLGEKLSWGLVPHIQALLLARYLRGDLDAYPPFLWK